MDTFAECHHWFASLESVPLLLLMGETYHSHLFHNAVVCVDKIRKQFQGNLF